MPKADATPGGLELIEAKLDDLRIDRVLEALAPTCTCSICNPLALPQPMDYTRAQAREGLILLMLATVRYTAGMEHYSGIAPGEAEATVRHLFPSLFRDLLPEMLHEVAAHEATTASKH